jgi:microcin C transport system permease protein
MRTYFLRRFLLIPPTLFGVTLLVFLMTRFVPGGPLEQRLAEMRKAGEGAGRGGLASQQSLSEEQLEQLKITYRLDQGPLEGYFSWLGLWPYADQRKKIEFGKDENQLRIRSPGPRDPLIVKRISPEQYEVLNPDGTPNQHWKWRAVPKKKASPPAAASEPSADPPAPVIDKVEIYRERFSGVLQGDFGRSFRYGEPVLDVILDHWPVTLYYGLMMLFLTYLISIPLGIFKALKHRQWQDNVSSAAILTGFAVPGYALGALLVTSFLVRSGWFPSGGFTSYNFESLSAGKKVLDILHHSALPLLCYLIGAFAFLTMMMKNQLMDNLAADYVRTAVAKGVPYRKAITGHALRNALIPIATYLGQSLALFVTGSFLIERVFDINGIGLLGFESIVDRDYPVVMSIVTLAAIFTLLGNIVGDFLVALVDPRVRFD